MTIITQCRICNNPNLQPILSFGCTPLANSLLTKEQLVQPEKVYPLDLVFCPDCTLVQITETVDPAVLFSHYLYFSSFSDTMISHAEALADDLILRQKLNWESLVVEIASNDGYLLKNYVAQGIPVLGIEPAQNIAKVANERGIRTVAKFFNLELAQLLASQRKRADIIHGNNVLAHVADLHGVIAGIAVLLKETGLAVIEAPYVKDLLDHAEFDTIYHEHLCYFSLTALDYLFRHHNLYIVDVERTSIHGGSLQILISHQDTPFQAVVELLKQEKDWGVDKLSSYSQFSKKVARLRQELSALVAHIKSQGLTIAVYGASAKGSTLLNYLGLDKSSLDFVVDRSTVKQGLYTPGTHLPIFSPEKLLEARPHYVLLLTWNFAEEILSQQSAYRRQGGKFIIPIPEVKVV
jgi:hypothetical protein